MTEAQIDAALRACAKITRTEARNFYHGLRLLPSPTREALYAVYAWMRKADDIADAEGVDPATRRARLDEFAELTRLALRGEPVGGDPILVALGAVSQWYRLPTADFEGALEGQRMDLEPSAYESFAQTELYCDRVASTVGRICLAVWGISDNEEMPRARELSTKRGIAFQLTNILRDVREDYGRGRCYLPADELAAAGLSIGDLVAWKDPVRCSAFMRAQCERAHRYFHESAALDAMVASHARPTIRAMSEIYLGVLRVIERNPAKAMRTRARLSTLAKSWIAVRARFGVLGSGGGR